MEETQNHLGLPNNSDELLSPSYQLGGGLVRQIRPRPARSVAPVPYFITNGGQTSKMMYGPPSFAKGQQAEHRPLQFDVNNGFLAKTSVSYDVQGQSYNETGKDFLTPYSRQRSQSMGANSFGIYDVSRASSRDSLMSHDSAVEDGIHNFNLHSEYLVEVTRRKLMRLATNGSSGDLAEVGDELHSISQPGTPPVSSFDDICRKYSEGSQRVHLKAKLQNVRSRYEYLPVDLSCKRKKFSGAIYANKLIEDVELDEGIDELGDYSLLKSVLTGRARSNSLSGFEIRRLRMAGGRANLPEWRQARLAASAAVPDPISPPTSLPPRIPASRQPVTLAKKTLRPVQARILDFLNKIVEFAKSLQTFLQLPAADQMTLLVAACPRLLLLFMAESNFEFAVTTIPEASSSDCGIGTSNNCHAEAEVPTMQFVECIQNFIRKCQAISITAKEYLYMKLIVLFHSGECSFSLSHQDNFRGINSRL